MTKTELVALVDRIYASWNQIVTPTSSKLIYETWWLVLKDLTVVDVNAAIDVLVGRDGYMPRPGTILRMVKLDNHDNRPPEPLEAWNIFRDLAKDSHNGVYSPAECHDAIKRAIAKLGGPASFELHTNGDRELFFDVYKKVVTEWEDQQIRS